MIYIHLFICFIILVLIFKINPLREHYKTCQFYNTCKWFHYPYQSNILNKPVFTQPMFTTNLIARDIGLNSAK
jgi:hypothetical protein